MPRKKDKLQNYYACVQLINDSCKLFENVILVHFDVSLAEFPIMLVEEWVIEVQHLVYSFHNEPSCEKLWYRY